MSHSKKSLGMTGKLLSTVIIGVGIGAISLIMSKKHNRKIVKDSIITVGTRAKEVLPLISSKGNIEHSLKKVYKAMDVLNARLMKKFS